MKALTPVRSSRRSGATTQDPPAKNNPAVNPEVVTSIGEQTLEDSHVYVHCHYNNQGQEMLIRVWKTTYLIDISSGNKSSLVHAENISMAPEWTRIHGHSGYSFLLIFGGLPKSCQLFDFKEEIPQPGGFFVPGIARNETDVYHVTLT